MPKNKYEMSVEEIAELEGNQIGSIHEFKDGKIKIDWISGLWKSDSHFGNYYVGGRVIESEDPDLFDAQLLATHCNDWNSAKKYCHFIRQSFKPNILMERIGLIAKNLKR